MKHPYDTLWNPLADPTVPFDWRKPRVVRVSDLFAPGVTDEERDRAWAMMGLTPHVYQVMTDFLERMQAWLYRMALLPLPNARPGVRVTTQREANERIAHLLQCPASVRIVEVSPREEIKLPTWRCESCGGLGNEDQTIGMSRCCYCGHALDGGHDDICQWIHQVIVAGQTGPDARPMHPAHVRSLRDQCVAAGVAFHFSGWGEWEPSDRPFVVAHSECTVRGIDTPEFCFIPSDGPLPQKLNDKAIRNAMAARNGQGFYRVGAKATGRMLDGREWNETPETQREGAVK